MSKVVGIDLGTTNSVVVVMEGGTPQVITNQEGARTTPSVVAFTSKGERLVGQIAKRQALTNPNNTIHGIKRIVGRRFNSPAVKAATRLSPYRIVEASNGDAHIQIGDRIYSPPEIEAVVLQKLKSAAEDYLGEPVEEAIISVPAYFNDSQRQATKDAGTIAGLKVQRILNEATAASLAYGMIEKKSGKVAIYDLGGGTFDISILELQDGIYQVLATGGDTYLGGQDFDELIMEWLVEEFQKEHGIDLTGDTMALQRLKEAAEKAKCELSTQPQAEILLPFISADRSGPKHLSTELSRSQFEKMIQPMLEHTATLCREALRDAGLKANEIDEVVPVGGQTRTPAVLEAIHRIFGREPNRSVNPDEVVAIGAAIQTGILEGEVTDLVLLDVTPHTLGIETKDRTFTAIIERNTNIPTKKNRIFTTVVDNQTKVEVHVLQGEGPRAEENTSLGRFMLTKLPPAPAAKPKIEVTFEIDVNGIVQVTALDQATGRQQNITVRAASGLTQAEVDKARTEAAKQAKLEDSLRQREKVTAQLQALIHRTRKMYELVQPRLTDDQRDQATAALSRAEQALGGSLEELQSALATLKTTSEALEQAMLPGGRTERVDNVDKNHLMDEKDQPPNLDELNPAEKMMLALGGDHATRVKLVQDKNRAVWAAVLCSPVTNARDIEQFSAMRTVDPNVLRAIAENKDWSTRYIVCLQLVMNPVTPEDVALTLLPRLGNKDLQRVADNPDLSRRIRMVAEDLRSGG